MIFKDLLITTKDNTDFRKIPEMSSFFHFKIYSTFLTVLKILNIWKFTIAKSRFSTHPNANYTYITYICTEIPTI